MFASVLLPFCPIEKCIINPYQKNDRKCWQHLFLYTSVIAEVQLNLLCAKRFSERDSEIYITYCSPNYFRNLRSNWAALILPRFLLHLKQITAKHFWWIFKQNDSSVTLFLFVLNARFLRPSPEFAHVRSRSTAVDYTLRPSTAVTHRKRPQWDTSLTRHICCSPVTTLCWFQCGETEVCAVPSATAA